jgi:hypothetical protein
MILGIGNDGIRLCVGRLPTDCGRPPLGRDALGTAERIPLDARGAIASLAGVLFGFPSNWWRVFRCQTLLAAVMREANRSLQERGGQKNAWHSRTDVGREWT